jgi:hypothetical protein
MNRGDRAATRVRKQQWDTIRGSDADRDPRPPRDQGVRDRATDGAEVRACRDHPNRAAVGLVHLVFVSGRIAHGAGKVGLALGA